MSTTPRDSLPIGTELDCYRITRLIGSGGFSLIYLAEDEDSHDEVAIKEYLPKRFGTRHDGHAVGVIREDKHESFQRGRRLFYQEARVQLVFGLAQDHATGGHDDPDFAVVVGAIDVDYRAPMFLREQPYDVQVWVGRTGRTSFVVEGEIRDGEQVLSACSVVMVRVDPHTQRPLPLSDHEKQLLRSEPASIGISPR